MKNVGLNKLPSVRGQIVNLTVNLVAIAVFYVFLGGLLSWSMWMMFPDFDEQWKAQSIAYKSLDVAAEISVIIIVAFWTTYVIHSYIPILPVTSALEGYIESFGGQMIFVYAVFVFLSNLDDKLKNVYHSVFGTKEST
jgi:hypothetical protein